MLAYVDQCTQQVSSILNNSSCMRKKERCPWAKYIVHLPPGQLQTLLPCGMILLSHQIMDVPLSHNRVVQERQKQAATAARTINIARSQTQIS